VLLFYISLLVFPFPSRLNLLHEFSISQSLFDPLTTLFSFVAVTGLISFAIYIARAHRLISFCIVWFFLNLLIESSVIGLEMIFEHRLYLPLFGFALIFSYLFFCFIPARLVTLIACSTIIVCLLGTGTYIRNRDWSDGIVLWSDVISKYPGSWRGYLNLGNALNRKGLTDEAISQFRKALYINPYSTKTHNNLGIVLKNKGNINEAIAHYYYALKYDPKNVSVLYNLGIALTEEGKINLAIKQYKRALELKPDYVKAHYNLGNIYSRGGYHDEAIYHYRMAIQQNSRSAEMRNNYGIALIGKGNVEEAMRQFTIAIQIDPQYANVYINLGKVHLMQGDTKIACGYFKRALGLNPGSQLIKEDYEQNCQ